MSSNNNSHIDNNDGRHRTASSLDSMTLLQISDDAIKETVAEDLGAIPKAKLLVMTDTDKLHDGSPEDGLLVDFEHDLDFENSVDHGSLKVGEWGCKKFYSDYIKEGLAYKAKKEGKEPHKDVVMLFESPSTSTTESSFHNPTKYRFHDWPPPKSTLSKAVLGPCRYGSMNGSAYPVFLRAGAATPGLMEHWAETIPNYCPPTWASKIEIEKDCTFSRSCSSTDDVLCSHSVVCRSNKKWCTRISLWKPLKQKMRLVKSMPPPFIIIWQEKVR
jgi:hypothetical protein